MRFGMAHIPVGQNFTLPGFIGLKQLDVAMYNVSTWIYEIK
jgi:hypothetical protein